MKTQNTKWGIVEWMVLFSTTMGSVLITVIINPFGYPPRELLIFALEFGFFIFLLVLTALIAVNTYPFGEQDV